MKKLVLVWICLVGTSTFAQTTFKINTKTNATSEDCYHDPCYISKSLSTKIISKSNKQTVVKIQVLGGYKDWESKKIKWNEKPSNLLLVCSKDRPRINGEILPLNENGPNGSNYGSITLYFTFCHSNLSDLSLEDLIRKYKYNVLAE